MDKEWIKNYLDQQFTLLNEQFPGCVSKEKAKIFEETLLNSNFTTKQAKELIDSKVNIIIKSEQKSSIEEKHYELNDLFDCRLGEDILHIHVVPKSLKETISEMGHRQFLNWTEEQLKDAFIKIAPILDLEENQKIENVFAISPLLKAKRVQAMFKKYGFDVSINESDYFKRMFGDDKVIGQAMISKEKFYEMVKEINEPSIKR